MFGKRPCLLSKVRACSHAVTLPLTAYIYRVCSTRCCAGVRLCQIMLRVKACKALLDTEATILDKVLTSTERDDVSFPRKFYNKVVSPEHPATRVGLNATAREGLLLTNPSATYEVDDDGEPKSADMLWNNISMSLQMAQFEQNRKVSFVLATSMEGGSLHHKLQQAANQLRTARNTFADNIVLRALNKNVGKAANNSDREDFENRVIVEQCLQFAMPSYQLTPTAASQLEPVVNSRLTSPVSNTSRFKSVTKPESDKRSLIVILAEQANALGVAYENDKGYHIPILYASHCRVR